MYTVDTVDSDDIILYSLLKTMIKYIAVLEYATMRYQILIQVYTNC
jgi:hypothetical protein